MKKQWTEHRVIPSFTKAIMKILCGLPTDALALYLAITYYDGFFNIVVGWFVIDVIIKILILFPIDVVILMIDRYIIFNLENNKKK